MTEMESVALVIAMAGGGVGAVLGIVNTWLQLSTKRVKLRVVPKIAFVLERNGGNVGDRSDEMYARLAQAGTPFHLWVEVVNLSAFPVTISDVGFGKTSAMRHTLINADLSAGKTWPPRLESREAVIVRAAVGEDLDPRIMQKPVAYAQTDCGITRYPKLLSYCRKTPCFVEWAVGFFHYILGSTFS